MSATAILRGGNLSIEPQVLYTLPELMARSGMGKAALRTARQAGLKVRYAGGRGYVKGSDFISYIEEHGKDEK